MSKLIKEEPIQIRYYKHLKKQYPEDVLVMNWEGWGEKSGQIDETQHPSHKGSRHSPFYGEFDIARFSRVIVNRRVVDLILYGYEVKGVNLNTKKKWVYPRISEGIDQALTLLFQNADYAFLITPRQQRQGYDNATIKFRDKYAPQIGLIFAEPNGEITEIDQRSRNQTDMGRKLDSLVALHHNGKYKNGSLRGKLWGRNVTDFYSLPDQS